MLKIVLINHSFQQNYYSRRWKLFAQSYPDCDVTLLTPDKFKWYNNKSYTYDGGKEETAQEVNEGNFHIKTFRLKYKHSWCSDDFKPLLLEIKPDIVYHIGTHTQLSLIQVARIVHKYLPSTKLMLFSMRGPSSDCALPPYEGSLTQWLKCFYLKLYEKIVIKYVRKYYDAVFCHYPDAVRNFRKLGFNQPIYMQTQVGVNPEWFYPNKDWRNEIREKYNIGDAYVFGSASRFTSDKGLDDIINAMPKEGDWKFMMMGNGSDADNARIKSSIRNRGLEDKIILTGFVDSYEIAKYWNAIDCAIHVPLTTPHWVETFSLAVVQAMITGKPIIGDTSGSVPYQIGPAGMIVHEHNIQELHDKIQWVLDNQQESINIGEKMRERALKFSIPHLNELFYHTIVEDVMQGEYDKNKIDMSIAL